MSNIEEQKEDKQHQLVLLRSRSVIDYIDQEAQTCRHIHQVGVVTLACRSVEEDEQQNCYFFDLLWEDQKSAWVVLSDGYYVIENMDDEDAVEQDVVESEDGSRHIGAVELDVLVLQEIDEREGSVFEHETLVE